MGRLIQQRALDDNILMHSPLLIHQEMVFFADCHCTIHRIVSLSTFSPLSQLPYEKVVYLVHCTLEINEGGAVLGARTA